MKRTKNNLTDSENYFQEYSDNGSFSEMPLNKKIFIFSAIIAVAIVVFFLYTFLPKNTNNNANKLTSSVTNALKQEQAAKNAQEAKLTTATTDTAPWFSLDESKIVFHNENFSGTTLVIPQKFNGTEITAIDGSSFAVKNTEITDLEIASSVETIEDGAFANFYALKNVVIPNSVRHIEGSALKNTPWYKSLDDEFYICGDNILIKYSGNSTEVTVPDGVKYLDGAVFANNKTVTSVTLPESVVYIGDSVFKDSAFSKFTPSPNITYVANNAFFGCDYIKKSEEEFLVIGKGCMIKYTIKGGTLRIPNTVRQISGLDLKDSGKNITMYMGDNVEKVADVSQLGYVKKFAVSEKNTLFATKDGALYNHSLTTLYRYPVYKSNNKYITPEKLKIIGPRAFYGCSIKEIDIENTVYSIGEEAFKHCTELLEADLPDSIVSLGRNTFEGCEKLVGAYLPKNIFSVPRAAFKDCKDLKNITLPDNLKHLRAECFKSCSSLKEMYISENIRTVAPNAFERCSCNFTVSDKNKIVKIKNGKPVIEKPITVTSTLTEVTSGNTTLKDAQAGE